MFIKIWWMRLESNQHCRKAGDLQSPGVTSFPTHPKCSASPGGNYSTGRYDAIIPPICTFHPLPDRDRSRIASGLLVRRLPPVVVTLLLILRVTVSGDTRNVLAGWPHNGIPLSLDYLMHLQPSTQISYITTIQYIYWKSHGESNPASQDENLMS